MKPSYLYYKFIRGILRLCFPRAKTVYEQQPDDEPAVFVCNHSAIRGPVMMTLDFKRKHQTWTVHCALDSKKAVNYAFHDILIGNSRRFKRFWRMLAHIVAKLLPPLLWYDTIPVYHDSGIIKTFKQSIKAMTEGSDLVISGCSPLIIPSADEDSDEITAEFKLDGDTLTIIDDKNSNVLTRVA